MNKNIKAFLLVTVFCTSVSVLNWNCTSPKNEQADVAAEQTSQNSVEYYTCPMHPSVHKDRPGSCPVCGMTLVKKVDEEKEMPSMKGNEMENVTISPTKQILANVSTIAATRMKLQRAIRAVGTTAYAEPNFRHITMRFPGRLEKLYLTYTGEKVRKGAPVADVYSPELISAEREYILALNSYDEVQQNGIDLSDAGTLLQQAKQKLVLWGVTEEQITGIQETKEAQQIITIYSSIDGTVLKKNVDPQQYVNTGENLYDVADLSTLWMNIDVYENEIQYIKIGQEVDAISEAYPSERFRGKIIFISPSLDVASRTIQVRVEFPNNNEKLKVGMYLNVTLTIDLPETIVVPASAVVSTGNRTIIWVRKSEKSFEPRTVQLGIQAEGYAQVLEGINEGDTVVTSGGYLLDSESQLQMGMERSEHKH